jgi:hypothetical protein
MTNVNGLRWQLQNVDFCGQLIISLWILISAWGYCLAGRSTSGQVSVSWQRQKGFGLKCPGTYYLVKVHDAIDLNKGNQDQWKQNSPITSKIHHHILH